jgi:hypothetical protein
MIVWMMQKTNNGSEVELATGTYADGLFPMTLKYPDSRAERSFRDCYARDTRLAHKRPPLADMAAG